MPSLLRIDLDDIDSTLEKMEEVSSRKNFSHWAIDGFKPANPEIYETVWENGKHGYTESNMIDEAVDSKKDVNGDLLKEWEISMFDGKPTDNIIKIIYAIVEVELDKRMGLPKGLVKEDLIEDIISYTTDNMHNFDPDKGKILPYFKVIVRHKIIRLLQ
jgi:hypothetical protein